MSVLTMPLTITCPMFHCASTLEVKAMTASLFSDHQRDAMLNLGSPVWLPLKTSKLHFASPSAFGNMSRLRKLLELRFHRAYDIRRTASRTEDHLKTAT